MGAFQRTENGLGAAVLTVDLDAVVHNYRLLAARAPGASCAAVVKADAYGLGAARIAPALARAGCRRFFVALPAEGIALRRVLGAGAEIFVLHGPPPGSAPAFAAHGLLPVLNSVAQAEEWAAFGRARGAALPAALQFDTGMARLGVPPAESGRLRGVAGLDVRLVMSHLACADLPDHPANAAQRDLFAALRRDWPDAQASLAASFGIFLGADYHFDWVRPGAALYGIAPVAGPNPMRGVARLQAPVIQVREVPAGACVGYGHVWRAERPARIATLGVGYADGVPRSLSNAGAAWLDGKRLPLAGRVSMDSITVDVSSVPAAALAPGTLLDLIGPACGVDALAEQAGTVGYEVLTRLGARFARTYVGG
ncbi:MAG TPA: alanine racemase [Acetobacteraceae bacterium]|nr:alanine racemase [Acetobacteraceae bacterium]